MPIKKLFKSGLFVKIIFILCLCFIIVISGLGYKHITNLSKSSDLVMHTYDINIELEQILSYLKDAETGQRGFLATKDSLYLEPYISGRRKINNSFAEIKALTKTDTVQIKNLSKLSQLIDKRLDNFEEEINNVNKFGRRSDEFDEAVLNGQEIMDSVSKHLKKMIALENKRLEKRENENQNVLKTTPIILYALVFLTLIIIYFSYSRITRDLEGVKAKNEALEIFKKATIQSERINNVGSWRWNIERDEFQFSENLFRLLGEEPYSFEQTVQAFNQFVHPDDLDNLSEQVEAMMQNRELPFVYFRVVHKDGTIRHLKSFGKSISNADGTLQLLGTTTDITDEIGNMHLLEQRNEELELNNKELQAFNYVASHDLQEPLRKIQTFVSRLEEKEADNLSSSGHKYIERITNAATRMRQLIDDLLQYSRTNKSNETLVKTDLNKLLNAATENLAEEIKVTKTTINTDKLPVVNVIPFQIQQLFSNLISNSIKYSQKGKNPIINITYEFIVSENDFDDTLEENNNIHEIIISDNGIGFEPEYANKIFILFNRLHNKDDYSGTGIGLSICKKIMDNHRGNIYAQGFPNQGAKFTIHLPS